MTETRAPAVPTERAAEVELVARLMRASGARLEPPREDYEHVLAAATAAFERQVARRRQRRAAWISGLAASLVAVASLLWTTMPERRVEPVSYPERLVGDVTIRAPGSSRWTPLSIGAGIPAQSAIRTARSSGAALRLAGGPHLRLDAGSEATFETSSRIALARGALYVDSGARPRSYAWRGPAPVEVVTNRVTARDVGTRFEVRLIGDRFRLRVRDGRVMLTHEGGHSEGGPGEQLTIAASGRLERSRIPVDDPGWQWITTVAIAPEIDNQPLSLVLDWVTHETGRSIRYSSRNTEEVAAAAILHGSIRGLEPLAALETVLATSELSYQIMPDGSILITSQ
jgi:ferric-dicitrate binding protein FerR (iron transport regulator)